MTTTKEILPKVPLSEQFKVGEVIRCVKTPAPKHDLPGIHAGMRFAFEGISAFGRAAAFGPDWVRYGQCGGLSGFQWPDEFDGTAFISLFARDPGPQLGVVEAFPVGSRHRCVRRALDEDGRVWVKKGRVFDVALNAGRGLLRLHQVQQRGLTVVWVMPSMLDSHFEPVNGGAT